MRDSVSPPKIRRRRCGRGLGRGAVLPAVPSLPLVLVRPWNILPKPWWDFPLRALPLQTTAEASGFRLQASGLRATAPHLCTWTPVLRISAVCPRAVATRVRPLSAAPCRRRPLPRRDRLVPLPLRRMRARSRIGGRKNGFGVDDSKLPRRADPHRRTQRAGCTLSARARRPFTRLSTSGVACFVAGRCVCAQS